MNSPERKIPVSIAAQTETAHSSTFIIPCLFHRMDKAPMKFPKVTVVLVSAALLFVVWEQTRERPEPVEAGRFTNLSANPVERSVTVDWLVARIPAFCEDAIGQRPGTEAHSNCVAESEARTSSCRRTLDDRFPSVIDSEAAFRDLSITAMNCLVPRSGVVE